MKAPLKLSTNRTYRISAFDSVRVSDRVSIITLKVCVKGLGFCLTFRVRVTVRLRKEDMEQRGSGCVSMTDFYPFDTMLVWVVGMAQCLCLSVFCLNCWTDQAGFSRRGFF